MDGRKYSVEGKSLIGRKALPSHCLFKIKPFSLLSNAPVDKYTTDAFDAGGFKWLLSLYPNGAKWDNGEGHISIYLESIETSSLKTGWEINAIANLFIFDQIRDMYVTFQDERIIWRYHAMKTKWGVNKFMDLKTFTNPLNGYLNHDTCVFGAEVFVVKNTFRGECLLMMKEPATFYQNWRVDDFSTLRDKCYDSEPFGCYHWTIQLFPNGDTIAKGNNISLYLSCAQSSILPDTKLFVKFIFRVKDQMNKKDVVNEAEIVISTSSVSNYGFPKFMALAKLKDPKQGYLKDDTCIIEAQVIVLGSISKDFESSCR